MKCIRMRGKKGVRHADLHDPPRRRANQIKGHGTWHNDRLPVAGVVGRTSGQVRLRVVRHANRPTLQRFVTETTRKRTMICTDEWQAYNHLPETGRRLAQVCHQPGHRVWARDDDGDGIREVHNNTLEGIWTGLRNFLRPFRGVNKIYLHQYVALFQWAHNTKTATDEFLQALLGKHPTTKFAT